MYYYYAESLFWSDESSSSSCHDDSPSCCPIDFPQHGRFRISRYGLNHITVSADTVIHHFAGSENTVIRLIISEDTVVINVLGIVISQRDQLLNEHLFKVRDMFRAGEIDEPLLNELEVVLNAIVERINYAFRQEYSLSLLNTAPDAPEAIFNYERTGEVMMIDGTAVLQIGKLCLRATDVDLSKWLNKKIPTTAIGISQQINDRFADGCPARSRHKRALCGKTLLKHSLQDHSVKVTQHYVG